MSVPSIRILMRARQTPAEAAAPLEIAKVFVPSGWMGDASVDQSAIVADFRSPEKPRPGSGSTTSLRFSYNPGAKGWAGIAWQYPADNWGQKPGIRIIGAKAITFWAVGAKGGEAVEFKLGGAKDPLQPYHDSAEKSLGVVALTKEWKEFTLDLSGLHLDSVIVGFLWAAAKDRNSDGLTFYLDSIKIE